MVCEEQAQAWSVHPRHGQCIDEAISHVRSRSASSPEAEGLPITLNFHPDTLHRGRSVIEDLA